jgi:hypothetical protein
MKKTKQPPANPRQRMAVTTQKELELMRQARLQAIRMRK